MKHCRIVTIHEVIRLPGTFPEEVLQVYLSIVPYCNTPREDFVVEVDCDLSPNARTEKK